MTSISKPSIRKIDLKTGRLKTKTGKKPVKQTKTKKTMSNMSPSASLSLPPCTLKYALACSDPFDEAAIGACIPVASIPSRKAKAFVEFDCFIGTSGIAFVQIMPSLASDLPSAYCTTAAFTGTVCNPLSNFSTLTTGVQRIFAPLPHTSSDLTGTLPLSQGRIVSAGIKLVYTGTNDNMSGLYYLYSSPEHTAALSSTTSTLGAASNTRICPVTRSQVSVTMSSVDSDENEYIKINGEVTAITLRPQVYRYSDLGIQNNGFTDEINDCDVGSPTAVCIITGIPGQSIHCTYVVHVEYVGYLDSSNLSPNSSDSSGTAMVMTAARNMQLAVKSNGNGSAWSYMLNELKSLWRQAKPMIAPTAINALRIGLSGMGL